MKKNILEKNKNPKIQKNILKEEIKITEDDYDFLNEPVFENPKKSKTKKIVFDDNSVENLDYFIDFILNEQCPEIDINKTSIIINNYAILSKVYILINKLSIDEITKDCIIPSKMINFITKEKLPSVHIFKLLKDKFYLIPKYYALTYIFRKNPNLSFIDKSGCNSIQTQSFTNYNFELNEILFKQVSAFDAVMKDLKDHFGALICLAPGEGKTEVAIKAAYELKEKVLILSHNAEKIPKQWVERFKSRINNPNLKAQLLETKKDAPLDIDVLCLTIQSLITGKINPKLLESYGFVIIDECHHINADQWKKSFSYLNPKYILGISGTPERKDGLDKILTHFIGPISYQSKRIYTTKVYALCHMLNYKVDDETKLMVNKMGNIDHTGITLSIFNSENRNLPIFNALIHYINFFRLYPNIKVILFSDFVEVLDYFFQKCLSFYQGQNIEIGFSIGDKSKEYPRKGTALDQQFIFTTTKKSGEGVDIAGVRVVIFLTSMKDISQNAARAMRDKFSNIPPLIIDFADQYEWLAARFFKHRMQYYKKESIQPLWVNIYPPKEDDEEETEKPKKYFNYSMDDIINKIKQIYEESLIDGNDKSSLEELEKKQLEKEKEINQQIYNTSPPKKKIKKCAF